MHGDPDEAAGTQGCRVVREGACAQTGEDAEGDVQPAYEDESGPAGRAAGDGELGDDPPTLRHAFADDASERLHLRCREAVEEEVGADQVVRSGR